MARFGLEKNPSDISEELAIKHKTLRKQLGLSQMELAGSIFQRSNLAIIKWRWIQE